MRQPIAEANVFVTCVWWLNKRVFQTTQIAQRGAFIKHNKMIYTCRA
jgi:hypothetical protein